MHLVCPRCEVTLQRRLSQGRVYWSCERCEGRTASLGLLRRMLSRPAVTQLWLRSENRETSRPGCACPCCRKQMVEISVSGENGMEAIDVCRRCMFIWFDSGEMDALPRSEANADAAEEDPRQALLQREVALMKVQLIKEAAEDSQSDALPDSRWEQVVGFLGLPVEGNTGQSAREPLVTWALSVIMILLSVVSWIADLDLAFVFGLVPAEWMRFGGVTFVTSFFLHGGIWHLLGNLYFLLVFGDDVEDTLGRWQYLGVVLICAMVGDVAHILADPSSTTPCVGASGGISGLLAFYALTYPRRKIHFLFHFLSWYRWLKAPAYVLFIVWGAYQALGTALQIFGDTKVSYMAHVGGAGAGLFCWILYKASWPKTI